MKIIAQNIFSYKRERVDRGNDKENSKFRLKVLVDILPLYFTYIFIL